MNGSDAVETNGNIIRLGFIGAGLAVRKLHLPVIERLSSELRVVAVASGRRETAAELAGSLQGARAYDDHHELLADPEVDAVLIAVPISLNGQLILDSVRAGKHVMAEKPLAATADEARNVAAACATALPVVEIAENFRYREDIAKARELIDQGAIGEVFAFQVHSKFDFADELRGVWTRLDWRKRPSHPGGFLLDCGVHVVAGVRDVLGEVAELSAEILDLHPAVGGPDSLLMQMRLESGIVGQYFSCYTARDDEETIFSMTVWGKTGTLRINEGRVMWSAGAGSEGQSFVPPDFDRGYTGQWKNFCAAVRGEAPVLSTPGKALRDLLVIDAALRSAASGEKVQL